MVLMSPFTYAQALLSKFGKVSPIVLRRFCWGLLTLPACWLLLLALTEQLGANPVEALQRALGLWALKILLISFAITPVRVLLKLNNLAPLRRTFGLFGFFYALAHLLSYLVLDLGFSLEQLWQDTVEKPYIFLGMGAFFLLSLLALTSPKTIVKLLGARVWKHIHKAVYPINALILAHYFWLKAAKNNFSTPAIYLTLFAIILLMRLWVWFKKHQQTMPSLSKSSH